MARLSMLTSSEAVHKAIAEVDKLGREAFLDKYKFGKALKYHLYLGGKRYDSKAVVAVAYGFQHPGEGPLLSTSFSGGEGQAARVLRKLGFDVQAPAAGIRRLVLAENEVNAGESFDWKDVTGERYHFPNAYRNMIVPGACFIYYKGARRSDGTRTAPEYFGCGEIGSVYVTSETTKLPPSKRQWLAEIADYRPFQKAVPFREGGDIYLETGTNSVAKNYWGVGVRTIEDDIYRRIVALGLPGDPKVEYVGFGVNGEGKPSLTQAKASLLKPPGGKPGSSSLSTSSRRPTKRAKEIGDAAERLFFDWLRAQESSESKRDKIRWVANEGGIPGYDIEDARVPGKTLGYEVKGTTGPLFGNFELTSNELAAARAMGENYAIVFVCRCTAKEPEFQIVWNPAGLLDESKWSAAPTAFRVVFG